MDEQARRTALILWGVGLIVVGLLILGGRNLDLGELVD